MELKQATECRLNFLRGSLSSPSPPSSTFVVQTQTWHFALLHRLPAGRRRQAGLPLECQPARLRMAKFSYCHHKQVYVLRNAGCVDLCRMYYGSPSAVVSCLEGKNVWIWMVCFLEV